MGKSREQLKNEYIASLDDFITRNPRVGQLDTAKFRDFLIGLVEHESGFNPTARQGSYFGWYQTNKLDSDPYQQHMNAFNHLNGLFKDTITKADIRKARELGIRDAALMLKYWNQGNRVNNYLWNNRDSADGLGTKISTYGNDLTMPLDIYNYAMDNLSGDYVVQQGDNWFNLQKRVRMPGRDYATSGKDLWEMQNLSGIPYGSLKIGQTFNFGKQSSVRQLPEDVYESWKSNPFKSIFNYSYNKYPISRDPASYQKGGLVYTPYIPNERKSNTKSKETNSIFDFLNTTPSYPVESVVVYKPAEDAQKTESVQEYRPTEISAVATAVTQPISTTTFHEEQPIIKKGIVEYKHPNLDVGNMQELINLMVDEGINFRITSGNRPGAITSSGKKSHHGSGNALDITPINGETWDDLLNQMRKSKKFISYMKEHELGILDERGENMQKKTGATGAHFHIGPDKIAQIQFKYLIG